MNEQIQTLEPPISSNYSHKYLPQKTDWKHHIESYLFSSQQRSHDKNFNNPLQNKADSHVSTLLGGHNTNYKELTKLETFSIGYAPRRIYGEFIELSQNIHKFPGFIQIYVKNIGYVTDNGNWNSN